MRTLPCLTLLTLCVCLAGCRGPATPSGANIPRVTVAPTALPSSTPPPTATLPTATLPPETVPPTPACTEAGTVTRGRIDEPARGYSYSYRVYLPPCYAIQPDRRFPVVYMIPGVGGGPSQWLNGGAAVAADEAVLSGAVPAFIIITTESTTGDPQGDTIVGDLVPAVDTTYRTLATRQYRAVAGASLGGSAAYRLAFGHPEAFSSAALFGAGLISGDEAQLQTWLAALPTDSVPRVFFNTGFGDPLMLERAELMKVLLDEAGVPTVSIFSEGEHDYITWAANLPAYFEWLAEGW